MATFDASRFHKSKLKVCPTLRYNNLCSGSERLCYTDNKQVHVIAVDSFGKNDPHAEPPVTVSVGQSQVFQSKFVHVRGTTYLVLTTDAGAQVWDAFGNNILFNLPMPGNAQADTNRTRPSFARGIASFLTADDNHMLAVGSSSGHVFLLEGSGFKFRHADTLKEHTDPITDLTSDMDCRKTERGVTDRSLVSADETGKIIVWEAKSARQILPVAKLENPDRAPCVGIKMRGDRLVAAYDSGILRFYQLSQQWKWMEVNAHSRFISSLTLHPTQDVLATAAEDSTLAVFTLPAPGQKTNQLMSLSWPDAMITGIAFCGRNGSNVAAVAYDVDEIRMWIGPGF